MSSQRVGYNSINAGGTWNDDCDWDSISKQADQLSMKEQTPLPLKSHAPRATVKCSYNNCHRHFRSEKEMKAHKKAEPEHEYCHKCDIDCEDDSDLLIHMIESDRHIVCPICGDEFKSYSGLELHIPLRHRTKQQLSCVGCDQHFTSAGSLMKHIEDDQCNRITQDAFILRKAEKTLIKDRWERILDQDGPASDRVDPSSVDAESSAPGGVSLGGVSLIDRGEDWTPAGHVLGSGDTFSVPESQIQAAAGVNLIEANDRNRDLNQYPQPGQSNPVQPGQRTVSASENRRPDLHGGLPDEEPSPWSPTSPVASTLFATSTAPLLPPTQPSAPTTRNRLPLSSDPNAQIRTQAAPLAAKPLLDRNTCYNTMTKLYECPGMLCNRKFTSVEAFDHHLRGPEHTDEQATCPGCRKHFRTTAALVAHCESPSRRCNIRHASNFNQVLRDITGGLLGTHGHHTDGSVKIVANEPKDAGFW